MIPIIWYSGKGKTIETVNISVVEKYYGGAVERMTGHSKGNFQGSTNTLYGTNVVITCHYTFVQTHRMYNTKNEP